MQLFTALLSALVIAASTNASPIHNLRQVVSPPITWPKRGVDWQIGSTQHVKWDTTQLSEDEKHKNGIIFLGMLDETGETHMFTKHPLAQGFRLGAGSQRVVVPNKPSVTTYVVALSAKDNVMFDDLSATFTIS
ncbi:hypothetical protein BGW80DRAFT_470016 [Lactifluus volemus]|nr:hypothetical protein BGW80DRAFT_470016 [Lactifluus volemus]